MTPLNAINEMQSEPYPRCPESIRHGFISIAVPEPIIHLFRQQVLGYFQQLEPGLDINDLDNAPDQLTHIAASFSDDQFIQRFVKGLRTFSGSASQQLMPWIEMDIKPMLNARRVALTRVSALDQRNNPTLTAEDYDVYWRCVRPHKPDIARPHTDRQFAHLNTGSDRAIPLPFAIRERWRVWFPLFGCHSGNSIQLIKDSYRERIPFTSIETVNGPRPDIEESWLRANEHRFECPLDGPRNGVLFRDDVVHRGPANPGPQVRISAEFTIVIQ